VSESSDTEQNSIVFMGRKSFRMQIGGEGAIPQASWETPTERMIERRKSDDRRVGGQRDRRKLVRGSEVAELPTEMPMSSDPPAARPARNAIVTIALVTFISGALVATAVDRLRRRIGFGQIAQAARVETTTTPAVTPPPPMVTPVTATAPVAQPTAPPALAPVILPLPTPKPEFLLARTAPETEATAVDARPERRPAITKATPVPRGALAPALRPRRSAAAASSTPQRATEPDPFEATKPAASKKWVDPFAE
jgi:hypothetical protein